MGPTSATSLAIFALEMTEALFGVQTPVNSSRDEAFWNEFSNQAATDTDRFLGTLQQLIQSTLADDKNYFQHFSTGESTAEFTHMQLSDSIAFDAITLEIPLKRNFLSRTLAAELTNTTNGSALTYTSTPVDVEEGQEAIYAMAV